jgi:hypothetical protein
VCSALFFNLIIEKSYIPELKKPPEGGFNLPKSLFMKEGLLKRGFSDRRR